MYIITELKLYIR